MNRADFQPLRKSRSKACRRGTGTIRIGRAICIALLALCGNLQAANYLIVTTEALAPGFSELADFRASADGGSYSTALLTVEEIHRQRTETTPEARIRAAIRDALCETGERYVVLGARAADIPPVRIWTPIEGIANNWTNLHGTPTDWYYACLDGEWTPTETGIYGYRDFASIDLTPEAYVGRIPAATVRDVRDYVRRLRRYTARFSDAALQCDRVLLHGLALGRAPSDWQAMGEQSDGFPWIGEDGHPTGAVDSELWLRNIARSRILPARPEAQFDLYFPGACTDPVARNGFTEAISINNPADLNRYLSVRPELLLLSSHGLPSGVGRLTPLSGVFPGNAWAIAYSVGCNTAQFDTLSLADAGAATGMAPPESGAFDGVWREYSLAEHLVPGTGDNGGLVYIASTREGFRIDGAGGIGAYSYAMMADFAERWAQGGTTVGAMFAAHKNAIRDRAQSAYDWRSLFAGVTYFGDPALRPMRDCLAAARSFPVTFDVDGHPVSRAVFPGQTLAEAAPAAGRSGFVLTGWRSPSNQLLTDDCLLDSSFAGTTLSAVYRAASDRETREPETSDPALARESFDSCSGTVSLKGGSLAASSKTTPVRMDLPATETARSVTVFLRHESGFGNEEDRGVAIAVVSGGNRLEFRRHSDLGYTVCVNGEAVAAFAVPIGVFVHLALTLDRTGADVFLNGRGVAAVPGDWLGNTSVYFGGASESGGYGWANAGTLYLDEASAFPIEDNWSATDFWRLQVASPGSIPARRVIPADGIWPVPAGADNRVAYLLEGAGKICPQSGAVVPEIASKGPLELVYPTDGSFYLSTDGLRQFGLDAIVWPEAVTPSLSGYVAVTEPHFRISGLSVLPNGRMELVANIEAENALGFAPAAALRGRNPFTGSASLPEETRFDGKSVRLVFPAVTNATRILRLELGRSDSSR